MNKRGISPIIASVLLIIFVILLFTLVATWIRRSALEPGMQAGEEKLASVLECLDTKLDVIDICYESNRLKLEVDNVGSTDIYKIGVRVLGSNKASDLEEIDAEAAPFVRISEETSEYKIIDYGEIDTWEVEVYPIVKTGICRDVMVIKNGITTCPT